MKIRGRGPGGSPGGCRGGGSEMAGCAEGKRSPGLSALFSTTNSQVTGRPSTTPLDAGQSHDVIVLQKCHADRMFLSNQLSVFRPPGCPKNIVFTSLFFFFDPQFN